MACMALDPWRRTVPEAKARQAKANSREVWVKCGCQNSRLQGGRKWKRELQSTIRLRSPAPPPQLCGRGRWRRAERASLLGGDDGCFNISCSSLRVSPTPFPPHPDEQRGAPNCFSRGVEQGLEAGRECGRVDFLLPPLSSKLWRSC